MIYVFKAFFVGEKMILADGCHTVCFFSSYQLVPFLLIVSLSFPSEKGKTADFA